MPYSIAAAVSGLVTLLLFTATAHRYSDADAYTNAQLSQLLLLPLVMHATDHTVCSVQHAQDE
jgi:hypothetical protein